MGVMASGADEEHKVLPLMASGADEEHKVLPLMASGAEEEHKVLPLPRSGAFGQHLSALAYSPRVTPAQRRHSDPMEKVIEHTRSGLESAVLEDFYRVCALDLAGLEKFVSPLHVEESFRSFQINTDQAADAEEGPLDASQVIACQEEVINTLFLQVRELESLAQSLYRENQALLYRLNTAEKDRASPRASSSKQVSPTKASRITSIVPGIAIPTSPREMAELSTLMCHRGSGGASPTVSPRGEVSPTGLSRASPISVVFGASTSPRSPRKSGTRPFVPPLNLRSFVTTISPRSTGAPKTLTPDGSSSPAADSPTG